MINTDAIKNICYGCMACLNICPVSAIDYYNSLKNGNLINIDSATCIKCGKCEKVCPITNDEYYSQDVLQGFWGFSNDDQIRFNSSSGGIFAEIANHVLKKHGVVFGTIFDNRDKSIHYVSTDEVELKTIMKSKYAESCIGNIYLKIRNNLEKNRMVLFCGTPCHVNGLLNYLNGKDLANLLTIDFLCHGVPSSKLLYDTLIEFEEKYGKISNIDFRPKEFGWSKKTLKIFFEDGRIKVKNSSYLSAFFNNYSLKNSCYSCKYRNGSAADITIGDFNGYRDYDSSINDEKGLSLIFTRSIKGQKWFDLVKNHITYNKLGSKYYEYAFAYDLCSELNKHEYFDRLVDRKGSVEAIKKIQRREFINSVNKKIKSYINK